jgi:hypothetical protein
MYRAIGRRFGSHEAVDHRNGYAAMRTPTPSKAFSRSSSAG